MKRDDFIFKIDSVLSSLQELELDSGVLSNTALYGLILSAVSSLKNACYHFNEYLEI